MTVFKHYFKIMKSHRSIIIGFTAILIGITILSAGSDVSEKSFSIVKPNMQLLTKTLIVYF